jgi:hypothetical protein
MYCIHVTFDVDIMHECTSCHRLHKPIVCKVTNYSYKPMLRERTSFVILYCPTRTSTAIGSDNIICRFRAPHVKAHELHSHCVLLFDNDNTRLCKQ